MSPIPPGNGRYSTDEAVKAWLNGDSSYGIPGGRSQPYVSFAPASPICPSTDTVSIAATAAS